jgi:hypothetical protein
MSAVRAVPSLSDLAKEFTRWRSTHPKHARVPDDLKSRAALLGSLGDRSEVAKALNVSSGLLQNWIDRLAPSSYSNDPPPPVAPKPQPPAPPPFIDVTSFMQPSPAPVPAPSEPVTIEFTMADRGSLKVSGILDTATIRFIVSSAFGGAR